MLETGNEVKEIVILPWRLAVSSGGSRFARG